MGSPHVCLCAERVTELKQELALSNARADALHGDFVKMRDLYDAAQRQLAEEGLVHVRERGKLRAQIAEEKKDFDALDDQYHRLGEKYEALQWQPITLEKRPKEGYEVLSHDQHLADAVEGPYRAAWTAERWTKYGYTWTRPINPPVQKPEATP